MLDGWVDPVAEVVEGVPTAPQDPVVRCESVVVELVARVREALAVGPADGGQSVASKRFGHQDVVVHRYDEAPDASNLGPEGVGCHDGISGAYRSSVGPDPDGRAFGPLDRFDRPRWRVFEKSDPCLLYTSPSPRDRSLSRMPSSA